MASFAPEVIFHIGKFPVTNTVINTIFVDGILLVLAYTTRSKIALIPGKFMNLMEIFIGGINDFVAIIAEDKTKVVFPVFMTFFLIYCCCKPKWTNTWNRDFWFSKLYLRRRRNC